MGMARSSRRINEVSPGHVCEIIKQLCPYTEEWPPRKAIAITINGRYFHSFSKIGRLSTAWHISGAALFQPWHYGAITKVMNKIHNKGYQTFLVAVAISVPEEQVVENNDPERMVVL